MVTWEAQGRLADLNFVDRCDVVHILGPRGTGKSHLDTALGVEAVKTGKSVCFLPPADLIGLLAKPNAKARSRAHPLLLEARAADRR
jgi:DNA replication protein DnaC